MFLSEYNKVSHAFFVDGFRRFSSFPFWLVCLLFRDSEEKKLLRAVNYFRIKFHHRCHTSTLMHLWIIIQVISCKFFPLEWPGSIESLIFLLVKFFLSFFVLTDFPKIESAKWRACVVPWTCFIKWSVLACFIKWHAWRA